jgi:hypothetical protein
MLVLIRWRSAARVARFSIVENQNHEYDESRESDDVIQNESIGVTRHG